MKWPEVFKTLKVSSGEPQKKIRDAYYSRRKKSVLRSTKPLEDADKTSSK